MLKNNLKQNKRSLRIDPTILKAIKIKAAEQNVSITLLAEKWLLKGLGEK